MTVRPIVLPSKGEINRSGEYLVEIERNGWDNAKHDAVDYVKAFKTLDEFRAWHQGPTNKVALGLRSMVRTATGEAPVVSQRLKRAPRIVRKLAKLDRSMLSRLEDVGGCRAVLDRPEWVELVRQRIEKNWAKSITRRRDYITAPNAMGYRALHFTVMRDERKIEVQVRTRGQQVWANAIEAADSRLGLTLKDGVGPDSMLEYFSVLGDFIYHQEYSDVTAELRQQLASAEDLVIEQGYYTRRAS